MKKITLMLLVAMVPFLTMAQKRSKKAKEKTEKSYNTSFEYMVISGYSLAKVSPKVKGLEKKSPIPLNKMIVRFDFGGIKTNDTEKLLKNARNYISMAAAVNGAANYGWEFVSANIVKEGKSIVHYYHMRRTK